MSYWSTTGAKSYDPMSIAQYCMAHMGIEAAYQLAGQTMACNMMDESALEGVQAFIDKRPPDWPHSSGR